MRANCARDPIGRNIMADALIEELKDGLLTLTMNRPERRNAMSAEMMEGLLQAVSRAAANSEVGAVLLRGAGGTFCVGGDVKGMNERSGGERPPVDQRAEELRRRMEVARLLHDMRKPTVAAISGAAAGAGLSLALACDIRVAGKSAKITTAFAKVGLSGDFGGTYFLTKLVGTSKARDLYFTSPILTGEEAYAMGIVSRVVPDAEVDKVAHDIALSLAKGPRVTLAYMKQNLNLAETMPLATVFDAEALQHSRCGDTEDHKEAAAAFVQKRQPVFKGR
jgi:2-(1,2-epoxy-1,2-dihydrophenyl)acetyl-CoA isomerase